MARAVAAYVAALAVCVAGQSGASCPSSDSAKYDCYPWGAVNSTTCAAHGCCWSPSTTTGVPWCFYPTLAAPSAAQCSAVTTPSRADCHPEPNADEQSCAARGCCWSAPSGDLLQGVPYCFFPHTDGYTAATPINTRNGFTSALTLGSQTGPYRNDISSVKLTVEFLTQQTMHFTLTDANNQRWQPPVPLQTVGGSNPPASTDYTVQVTTAPQPFGILVTRTSTGQVLFDSRVASANSGNVINNGLIFEDQYFELSTALPPASGPDAGIHIYGLAEHIVPLQLPFNGSVGQTYTMFAKDQGTPVHSAYGSTNLYASQPFHMVLDPATGDAFGVFLFNSNGMDVVLQPNSLTYRVIGGYPDVYIFTGPTPADVVQQYLALVGTPRMPPRWALGFHLCRWGYNSLNQTYAIWQSMQQQSMPQDAQWNDIDYMDQHLDFTTDPVAYPTAAFGSFVRMMQQQYDMHYVPIFDPAISSTQSAGTYPAWDDGVQQDVFIKSANGSILIGQVWPGYTAFPDFFSANAQSWWTAQIQSFHNQLPFDGMWIDMNEPSNFCNGECATSATAPGLTGRALLDSVTKNAAAAKTSAASAPAPSASPAPHALGLIEPTLRSGVNPADPMFPPYLPGRLGGATLLEEKTVSMSASQSAGMHYNLHNMYGWSEGVASVTAMESIRGKRGMIISRSTFPTSGQYVGHWLGDNAATWDDLYYSIPGVLTMNMLGIPLVGADTCGFGGPATTPELCTRWMQLGAFVYGFYRNHNTIGKQEQAPSVFSDPYRTYMRNVMNARLGVMPYLYTLFHNAHAQGDTVTRPLFFEFPNDANVAALDTQVMLGPAFLVSPVIVQGDVTKNAYFPAGVWYDWFQGTPFSGNVPGWNVISAPLSNIPVHIRGGYIVPTQTPNMTTVRTALTPYGLTVALDANGAASGSVFVDDGDALLSYERGLYSAVSWAATTSNQGRTGTLTSTVQATGYTLPATATLQTLRILGVSGWNNGKVTVNGAAPNNVSYDPVNKFLLVSFNQPLMATLSVQWSG